MTQKQAIDRRTFLNKIGTTIIGSGSVLIASSSLVQAAPIQPVVDTKSDAPKSTGYQRTKHVETYYQLADF